ncbi:hypothetical protein [Natronococcus pandeyae]|uniref:hypothetical protein n=1 Tax=Natronococcus pandeyae TaxID=2055836 RepID=UPI0011E69C24|nr:hypothetical protein [Natronococcus pandeyae]
MKTSANKISTYISRYRIQEMIISGLELMFIQTISRQQQLYETVAPKYYRWRASSDVFQYDFPPDRFKVVWVDPDRIKYRTNREHPPWKGRRKLFGKVTDGDWDRPTKRFDEYSHYRAIKRHFVEGVAWEATEFWQKRQNSSRDSDQKLRIRVKEIEELYRSIAENGFKTQLELLEEDDRPNEGLYLDAANEIAVDIGRDGELLFVDGKHRLSIAKILDLDSVPIVILVRHSDWMEHRDEVLAENPTANGHPDLPQWNGTE